MQSWQNCTLSGEQINTPVISKLTGHLFEKRVIEKHIESTGTCPISGRPMTIDDLITINVSSVQRPRPIGATSVPQLLSLMQTEWDALLLEQFQLKQHLENVRNELTHALYQHDAACRVIARLIKERDQARMYNDLANLQQELKQNGGKMNQESHPERLPEEVSNEVEENALKLNNLRKLRRKQTDYLQKYPAPQIISNYSIQSTIPTNSISTMDLHKINTHIVALGSFDASVTIFDCEQNQVLATLKDHKSIITSVNFIYIDEQIRFITTSEDGNAIVYALEGDNTKVTYNYQAGAPITGSAVHPLAYLVILVCLNGSFSFHDVSTGSLLCQITEFKLKSSFKSVSIHPDGHFAALGTSDGAVKIWKISSNQLMAELEGHKFEVDNLSFSENGVILASSSSQEGIVNIWNLRTSEVIKTLFKDQKQIISSLQFDESSQYLFVGAQENIYMVESKKWDLVCKFSGHKDLITGVKLGQLTNTIVTSSKDQQLIIYGQ